MIGIQILSIVFIFIMLYVVRIHYKKNEIPRVEAIFWTLVLAVIGTLVIVEQSANFIRSLFSVTRLTDVIVIFALMGVFIVMIENRIQINKLRQKLELLTRKQAMEE